MEEHTATVMVSLHNQNPQVPSQQAESQAASTTPIASTSTTTWAQWDSKDTAHLAAANLAVTKVQHAWERRPQSPFTRRRLKVGKVWKRAGGVAAPSPSIFNFGGSGATIRPESPLRAVKKMRGAAGEQVVRDWDVRGSPRNRRIVTRGNRDDAQGEFLELEEEDVEPSVNAGDTSPREEVLRVEIENEDGTIVELDAEEGEAEVENDNWDDESMTEEEVWDATLMHLAETIGEPEGAIEATLQHNGGQHEDDMQPLNEGMDTGKATLKTLQILDDITPTEQLHSETVQQQVGSPTKQFGQAPPVSQLKSALRRTSQFGAIPEGFVSPVKQPQRRTINQVRLSNANRRRTLPVNFAAQNLATSAEPASTAAIEDAPASEVVEEVIPVTIEAVQDTAPQHAEDAVVPVILTCDQASGADIQAALDEDDSDFELKVIPVDLEAVQTDEVLVDGAHDENAWEDVGENESHEHACVNMEEADRQQTEIEFALETLPPRVEQFQEQQIVMPEAAAPTSPTKLYASTKPLFDLRRSPRRQSTSPVRQSGILPPSSRPHLVAFTPIKLPVYTSSVEFQSSPLPTDATREIMDLDNPTPLPQLTRSSSAPPEEAQMSPRRPKQPRISDDTALLQAFLNRAAESKTSKDSSITAKRESMENRRDSTSVRLALASPAPLAKTAAGEVLADLDPNSPSPRKQSLAANLMDAAQTNGKSASDQDEDELALNATPDKRTSSRKSSRVKKKVSQVLPATTYSATSNAGPNRIAIRGADVVVLKKTEAQEIAQVTRHNTRKNKSGAVLPPLRLTRLTAEKLALADEIGPPDDEDEMNVDVPAKAGRRAVKWAETLASFHEGANEPEMSMLSDELNVAEETSAPAASDTPSKPSRLRRLRTPRPTASSSGSSNSSQEVFAPAVPPPAEVTKPARVTKRSSRIATPAKLPGAAKSLLPDGLDVEEPAPVSTTKKAPVTRKKAPSSKLPAPASSLTSSTAVGKENSLIASPPKKRATTARASAVPKLDFKGAMDASLVIAPPGMGIAASPAKKGSGRAQVLFKENGDVSVKRDEVLGMASPAKKRGRRML